MGFLFIFKAKPNKKQSMVLIFTPNTSIDLKYVERHECINKCGNLIFDFIIL